MKKNKKRAFTLVELLAVIVILAVILIIAIPRIQHVIENARKESIASSVKMVAASAETEYAKRQSLGESTEGMQCSNVAKLNNEDYASCEITFNNGRATVTIVGSGKFKGYTCTGTRNNVSCTGGNEELVLYKEAVLNGADPVMSGDLIPVTIADNGTVTKADIYESWYNYESKNWANAVILEEDAPEIEVNETIDEEYIESYFVWIPRYRYELFAPTNHSSVIEKEPTESIAKTINIVFENKEASVSTEDSGWLTHPAFTTFDVNGLWVAKFETTGTIDALTVKPSSVSLRSQTIKSMFEAAYNYSRDNDSHMMKNTEWGAVAYLSHSIYGINDEVNINNYYDSTSTNRMTGYSAAEGTNQSKYPGKYGKDTELVANLYNTKTGYIASTTGNISGIYDMSGGGTECMASYMSGADITSSGFTTATIANYESKYFDVYASGSTSTSYKNRILGDATGEMGPFYKYGTPGDETSRNHNNWYADSSYFVDSTYPWFTRGGSYDRGILSGQFRFHHSGGVVSADNGFRLVLAS